MILVFRVPTYLNSTIFGWKSLREMYGNYFGIDSSQIGKRIDDPHTISIKTLNNNEEYTIDVKFDTIDDYITNMNYKYEDGFLNMNEFMRLEEWLKI